MNLNEIISEKYISDFEERYKIISLWTHWLEKHNLPIWETNKLNGYLNTITSFNWIFNKYKLNLFIENNGNMSYTIYYNNDFMVRGKVCIDTADSEKYLLKAFKLLKINYLL